MCVYLRTNPGYILVLLLNTNHLLGFNIYINVYKIL